MKKTAVVLSAIMMSTCLSVNSQASNFVETEELSGANRFSTAISIAKNGWPEGAKTVILVNSQAVADSLSVAPYASEIKAPVLLTNSGNLNKETAEEIKRLGATEIVIIGGEGSVSKDIETSLLDGGYSVNRISGSTRIETSINIARSIQAMDVEFNEAFVVNGMTGLADAAGIGAIAAKKSAPIIFTKQGSSNELSQLLKTDLEVKKAFLIGGGASLSNDFNKVVDNTERIAGRNRQETNLSIINRFYPSFDTVYIADDGSSNSSKLIDSVLINAGIIASNKVEEINPEEVKPEEVSPEEVNPEEELAKAEDVAQEDSETVDTSKKESGLKEGPVMLVSGKNGFTYKQMADLNKADTKINKLVQVSGGAVLKEGIDDMAYFISNKGNPTVDKLFNKLMRYRNMEVGYYVAGNVTYLKPEMIRPMIYIDQKTNSIKVKKAPLESFAKKINVSGLKGNKVESYAYWKNRDVKIDTVREKVGVDVNKEVATLVNIVENGWPVYNRMPNLTRVKNDVQGVNLGSTYVQIGISSQHMKVYRNGKVVVSTPIVTGNPNKGNSTPPGIFKIKSKMRNVVLRGPGYASPVQYWIPFNGSIGIHDASWQPVYGGTRYLYAGSLGCVNTPLRNVATLYNYVSVGTPVIVQQYK